MNQYDYPTWELKQDYLAGDQICKDYDKKDGEPWICFDCHYKKNCMYKRDRDVESIFKF